MTDPDLQQKILDAVDARFDDQVAFTRDLVAYPSVRGQEHTAQEFLYNALAGRGYAMYRWAIDISEIEDHPGYSPVTVNYDNAINVVATHTPRDVKGKSLVLNGHVDVVPTGPDDMWSHPPFAPHVDGDWLFGRGSGDMKAGIAANIFALDALRSPGYQPAATVYVQCVTEEECTGNGALACMARGYRADAAIIPEPVDDMLVRANVGVIWFQVKVRGLPVHVREAAEGSNAIEAAYTLIRALRGLEEDWNSRKDNYAHFGDLDHPINFNIGKIQGGDWASSVPAWCTLDCRIALFPGMSAADGAREIEGCLQTAARNDTFLANNPPDVVYNGFFAEGYTLPEGSEAEALLARTHAQVYGHDLKSFVTPAYLDGRVFVLYQDTPCLVYGPISKHIHGFDERVSLSSTRKVTQSIALFIAEWCGLEAVD